MMISIDSIGLHRILFVRCASDEQNESTVISLHDNYTGNLKNYLEDGAPGVVTIKCIIWVCFKKLFSFICMMSCWYYVLKNWCDCLRYNTRR